MPARRRKRPKIALVCAGGGVTGAVYEIGCLRALDEILGPKLRELDLYVGISGGAFVASLLAAGVSPREMYDEAILPSRGALGAASADVFRWSGPDLVRRVGEAPRLLASAIRTSLSADGNGWSDLAWSLFQLLPAGLLTTEGIREYLERVFRARLGADRFARLRRPLNVVAVDLDSGEAVAFGQRSHRDVPISTAVAASTALPGLYRPVRIKGRDYVDGGVRKTAHINLAIQSGATLVICINPIVPYLNDTSKGALAGHLSNRGVTWVLDQVMRIVLHGRMAYGMERYRREHPDVDILLLQPTRDDVRMFGYNIMRTSARRVVAEHGYRTALAFFRSNAARHRRLFARHGIELRDPRHAPDEPLPRARSSRLARTLTAALDRLESRLGARR
jgi:predicted acylesterase/phospholipase RssA